MDGVVEAMAGSGIYVRDNLAKKDFKKSIYSKDKIRKPPLVGQIQHGDRFEIPARFF